MRSKAPLALMEQMVMLLVFALAAALCLQAFVKSDEISKADEERGRAAALCQSAAEVIRSRGGEPEQALSGAAEELGGRYEQGVLWLDRGEGCRLTARGVPSGIPGLSCVRVAVERGEEILFEINTAWQTEVSGGAE